MADLGLLERSTLVVLAAHGSPIRASELREQYGLNLTRPSRTRLADAKLLTFEKDGRSFALTLTDAGWRYLDKDVLTDPPSGAGSGGKALFVLLSALSRTEQPLHDLLRGGSDDQAKTQPDRDEPLPKRIERSYRALAKRSQDWVALTSLREALGDVKGDDLDAALKTMRRDKLLTMTLEEDQSSLSKADRDAAIRIGSDDMHYVSMR